MTTLSSCVGVPLEKAGDSPENAYDQKFAGHTRDDIIIAYGAPDRTVKLDNGWRFMEYKSAIHHVYPGTARKKQTCSLRLWYKTTIIIHADYLGDSQACSNFVFYSERDAVYDSRY